MGCVLSHPIEKERVHMQSELTGQVTSVQGRAVKSGTIFDVTIGTQKVSTFKAPVAEKAQALLNQNVKATVDVTQNGQYTNYTLLDVGPAGVSTVAPTTIPVTAAPTSNGTTDAARQDSIVRQVCIKAAGHAFAAGSSADEVLQIAEKFYRWVTGAEQQIVSDAEALVSGEVPW